MKLNSELTRRQEQSYDYAVSVIREFGSYNWLALRIFENCGREVTGETIRAWFTERRVPTHIVFILYEICGKSFKPLALCPWLGEFVEMKAASKSG